jgi:acetyltransferase-like isoleucine patch superfamily enzyme
MTKKVADTIAIILFARLGMPLFRILARILWFFGGKNKNIQIGEYTYFGGIPKILMLTNRYRLVIGKFCSLGPNVRIVIEGNHRTGWISTYPFGELILAERNLEHQLGKGDMIIGNDVWIGQDVLIVPGVQIGDGAVIAAGSVVTKNVDDYEIVGGNPARHIRNRFTDEQIRALKEIKWWDWPIDKVKAHYHLLQSSNIDEFIEAFR